MRREQFTLEVIDVDWVDEDREPRLPTLSVTVDGDESPLEDRFGESGETAPTAEEIDVTVRLYGNPEESDAAAVVAVTDRITGEYVIEVDVESAEILSFVTAARRYGELTDDSTRYRVRAADDDGEPFFDREKRTLLVYSGEGELLRGHSLIPNGVEI